MEQAGRESVGVSDPLNQHLPTATAVFDAGEALLACQPALLVVPCC